MIIYLIIDNNSCSFIVSRFVLLPHLMMLQKLTSLIFPYFAALLLVTIPSLIVPAKCPASRKMQNYANSFYL